MLPRAVLALVLLALLTAGCTSSGPAPSAPAPLRVNGVAPEGGNLTLTGTDGLTVVAEGNGILRLGHEGRVTTRGHLHACRDACETFEAPDGMVVAEGSLLSYNNLTLNARGPDHDSVVFFYDGGQVNGQYLRWYDAAHRFEASDDLDALGNVTGRHHVGTVTTLVLDGGQGGVVNLATAAVESTEALVLLRGRGQLTDGVANLTFPPTFRALVGRGDLTAQVTPTARGPGLWVASVGPDHLRVETLDGQRTSQTFHYVVHAVRAASEDFQPLRVR